MKLLVNALRNRHSEPKTFEEFGKEFAQRSQDHDWIKPNSWRGRMVTWRGRYSKSMREAVEMLKGRKDIVAHIIGLGNARMSRIAGVREKRVRYSAPNLVELTRTVRRIDSKARVYAMDAIKDVIDEAKKDVKNYDGVSFLHMDVAAPTAKPVERADLIVCTNLFPYLPQKEDQKSALVTLASMLKKGGVLLTAKGDFPTDERPEDYGLKKARRATSPASTKGEGVLYVKKREIDFYRARKR